MGHASNNPVRSARLQAVEGGTLDTDYQTSIDNRTVAPGRGCSYTIRADNKLAAVAARSGRRPARYKLAEADGLSAPRRLKAAAPVPSRVRLPPAPCLRKQGKRTFLQLPFMIHFVDGTKRERAILQPPDCGCPGVRGKDPRESM